MRKLLSILFLVPAAALADPIVVTDALTDVDASATFDNVTSSPYTEDGLTFLSSNGSGPTGTGGYNAFGDGLASGIWYFNFTGYVEVRAASGFVFDALQFLLGDAFTCFGSTRCGSSTTNLAWQILSEGISVDSGVNTFDIGSVVRFSSSEFGGATFDTLRIAAGPSVTSLNEYQSVSMDNFAADYVDADPISVSEPGTLALFGLGLLGIGAAKRRRPPTVQR